MSNTTTIQRRDSAATELAANATRPFEQAYAMRRSVYQSEDFLQQELDNFFRHDWFCAGRASAVANPGDFLSLELSASTLW